jgi:hypothetical protein
MPNETPEQTADRLEAKATATFASFQATLTGTGANFQDFHGIQADAVGLAGIGSRAAENIQKIRNDQNLPEEIRARRIANIEADTQSLIASLRAAVIQRVEGLENSLMAQVLPGPQPDGTRSLLHRQELDMLVAAAMPPQAFADKPSGKTMLQTLTDLAVANPSHAQEILGPWGQAQMARAGESKFTASLQRNVAHTLAATVLPTDSASEKAVKAALVGIKAVKGQVDGFQHSAQMRLDSAKPKPGSMANAPDTLIPVRTAPTVTTADLQSKARFKSR